MAVIGAGFGFVPGQWLRLPRGCLALLLACGAGAGIAAAFNAPVAGAFFLSPAVVTVYPGGLREVVLLLERSPLAGRRLSEARLPQECVVVSVTQGSEVLVPHGATEIRPGDRLLVFAVPARRVDELAEWQSGASVGPAGVGAMSADGSPAGMASRA